MEVNHSQTLVSLLTGGWIISVKPPFTHETHNTDRFNYPGQVLVASFHTMVVKFSQKKTKTLTQLTDFTIIHLFTPTPNGSTLQTDCGDPE